jgi:myo-inositol-1(or 4)-monophosphatase
MKRDKSFLRHLALKAAHTINALGEGFEVKVKPGRGNFVTDADFASEQVIMDEIRSHFPDDKILSEETANDTTDALKADHIWIIDPIDGTNNFRFGRHYSAISIGYATKGELQEGIVYNFSTQELYQASKGNGAFYNEIQMQTPQIPRIDNISVGIGNSSDPKRTQKHLNILASIEPVPWVSIRGSSALEISEIARGSLNAYIHSCLHPWDVAAAMLIVRESGGVVKNFKGEEATFLSPDIIAGYKDVVDQLLPYIHES